MNNIVIGNGFNIHFDESKNKWDDFVSNCQFKFRFKMDEMKNSNNKYIKTIWCIWNRIEQYINFDKECESLEDISRFFIFNNYLEILGNNEYVYKSFLEELWFMTISDFIDHQTRMPLEVPNVLNDPGAHFFINMHLDTLKEIYKKMISDTLFDEYKINSIKIPQIWIEYINKRYSKKISLNYDNNLDALDNLMQIHGTPKIIPVEIIKDVPMNNLSQEIIEFNHFEKQNTLQWGMVLDNSSRVKKRRLEVIKHSNFKEIMKSFGVDESNLKFNENILTYDELNKMEGIVDIIGVSKSNDEEILKILSSNTNVTKINYYTDDEKKDIGCEKTEVFHYDLFWNKI